MKKVYEREGDEGDEEFQPSKLNLQELEELEKLEKEMRLGKLNLSVSKNKKTERKKI